MAPDPYEIHADADFEIPEPMGRDPLTEAWFPKGMIPPKPPTPATMAVTRDELGDIRKTEMFWLAIICFVAGLVAGVFLTLH